MSERGKGEFSPISETNLDELRCQVLFSTDHYPPTDPRSNAYVRTLIRPKIRWRRLLAGLVGGVTVVTLTVFLAGKAGLKLWQIILMGCTAILCYGFLLRKHIALGAIRLYQHFASDTLRNRCMFEPSCSEYMRQAIEKYGTFRGIRKGINRLKRCNVKGGGFDPVP